MRPLRWDEAKICHKLYRNGHFGKGDMLVDTLVNGFPSHEQGHAKDAVEDLKQDGILGSHPRAHGESVYLNKNLSEEIWERITQHDDFAFLSK